MPFGIDFGRSSQSARSEGFDVGFSNQQSSAGSVQDSISQAVSGGQAVSRQDIAFRDVFANLFQGAAATASGLSGQPVRSAADMLFSQGTNFLSQLQGLESADFLRDRLGTQSPVVDDQIEALGQDLGRFAQEQLLPGVRRSSVAGGSLGGGRQAIAEGLVGQTVAREFQQGAAELRGRDLQARDQIAQQLAQLEQSSAATGLTQLEPLLGLAEREETADLLPFATLSSILGGPVTLSESEQQDFSQQFSESLARSFNESFGESFNFGRQTSRSSGSGINFGFGLG